MHVYSPCEVCGFDILTESHHIIRKVEYGADNERNIVILCPNHHKMADNQNYFEEMKKLIFEKTGKIGEILSPAARPISP